jgi:hypothetical protein
MAHLLKIYEDLDTAIKKSGGVTAQDREDKEQEEVEEKITDKLKHAVGLDAEGLAQHASLAMLIAGAVAISFGLASGVYSQVTKETGNCGDDNSDSSDNSGYSDYSGY